MHIFFRTVSDQNSAIVHKSHSAMSTSSIEHEMTHGNIIWPPATEIKACTNKGFEHYFY